MRILWRTSPTRGRSTRFTCVVKKSIARACGGSGRNKNRREHMKFRLLLVVLAVLAGGLLLFAQLKEFRPVTEAMLRNPAPGDWLNWRRTDNAWGYSPLDQITRQNVTQLQLAWSWAMDDTGANEATPLVYDGIMYLPNPRGRI